MSTLENVVVQSLRKDRKGFKITHEGQDAWFQCTAEQCPGNKDTVSIEYTKSMNEKGQPQRNVVTITTVKKSQWSGGQGGFSKGGKSNDVGMMVGNAITNATAIAIANKPAKGSVDVASIEGIARELCKASEALKKEFEAGAGGATSSTSSAPKQEMKQPPKPKPEPKQETPDFDDDLPF